MHKCASADRYPRDVLLSLVVVFLGVSMYAAKGEMDYTMFGLMFTVLGVFLAALKGVRTLAVSPPQKTRTHAPQ